MSSSFEGSEIFEAPPEKIFSLINNFEFYKDFLPGCLESSRLPSPQDDIVVCGLVFSVLNQTYVFESENKIVGNKINIHQSQGPFSDFFALWTLDVIDENLTKVTFETKFSLPFILQVIATESLIDKIGSKFIHAFATQLSK